MAAAPQRSLGDHLRDWRRRRRLSQLDLAGDAGISARHLSFVESGRATPSRDMVLRLARQLEVPLREQNAMLVAAGYAPAVPARPLVDPSLASVRGAISTLLLGFEPFPALAIDRAWNMVAANGMIAPLVEGVAAELLRPPVNILRLSLHPAGLAPRIVNLAEWRAHLLDRLHRDIEATGDPELEALEAELRGYPARDGAGRDAFPALVAPLQLRTPVGELALLSTTTIFGTPTDVTLAEVAIEAFLPADAATGERLAELRRIAG